MKHSSERCAPAVVALVAACSGMGKTTLIEALVPLLKGRGLTVAVLKHHGHSFDSDRNGKDTHRFAEAGAGSVMLASDEGFALFHRTEQPCPEEELVRLLGPHDVVLVEGFKRSAFRKIEIFRKVLGESPLFGTGQCTGLMAVASDTPVETQLPQLDLNAPEAVCQFILDHLPELCLRAPAPITGGICNEGN